LAVNFKNDEHLSKAIGKYVNVKTYEKIQIDKYLVKEFEGDLISFNDEEYVIETMIKTRKVTVNVKRQLVAKIRLAIKF
jgi:ribosome maturation factor RimP